VAYDKRDFKKAQLLQYETVVVLTCPVFSTWQAKDIAAAQRPDAEGFVRVDQRSVWDRWRANCPRESAVNHIHAPVLQQSTPFSNAFATLSDFCSFERQVKLRVLEIMLVL
jgi:hypothetical protein